MPRFDSRAVFEEDNKRIIFHLSDEVFWAFKKGYTHGEMYVPCSDLWKRRLLAGCFSGLAKEVRGFDVIVTNSNSKRQIKARALHAEVRRTPLRPYERAGKHIVLLLAIRNENH